MEDVRIGKNSPAEVPDEGGPEVHFPHGGAAGGNVCCLSTQYGETEGSIHRKPPQRDQNDAPFPRLLCSFSEARCCEVNVDRKRTRGCEDSKIQTWQTSRHIKCDGVNPTDTPERQEKEKLLIWSVCTLAFTGGFRIGEILSKRARTIDPDFDLQKKDIKLVSRNVGGVARRLLVVTLKCPKETQQNKVSIKVEVFGNSTRYDPVRAYMEYVDKVGVRLESSAAFRLPYSGSAYRHQRFNLDLKKLLQPFLSYGFISGHSFRQGMATLMGRAGFEDHEIQACGRWSSSAFLRYIKLGRLTRARWSDRLAACIESSAMRV